MVLSQKFRRGTLGLHAIISTIICESIKIVYLLAVPVVKFALKNFSVKKNGVLYFSVSLSHQGLFLLEFSRYRGNWRGDLPEGKGEYQVH